MKSYIQSLAKYSWIMIITLLFGILAGAVITNFKFKKTFKATSTIYVYILNDISTKTSLDNLGLTNNPESTYQSLQSSEMLVKDFQQMIKTSNVINEVEAKYEKSGVSNLFNDTTINAQAGTRVIDITVENEDAELAANLSNSIAESFKNMTNNILNIDTINIIGSADNNIVQIGSNKYLVIIGFAFFGILLGLIIIYLIDFYKLGYRPVTVA